MGAATLLAINLYGRATDQYGADLAQAERVFLLEYFLKPARAITQGCGVLFFIGTVIVLDRLVCCGPRTGGTTPRRASARASPGPVSAAGVDRHAGARWYENRQIRAGHIDHIPVSNLPEVFVLVLAHGRVLPVQRASAPHRGAGCLPVMLAVVSAAVGFLLYNHGEARRAGNPAAGARAAKLVDEAARAGQLHRLPAPSHWPRWWPSPT
ncbi:MAG: hypothetical protein IPP44_23105 [Ideonella sp.]|nr:hypothetical protein [Ideonella sp.]